MPTIKSVASKGSAVKASRKSVADPNPAAGKANGAPASSGTEDSNLLGVRLAFHIHDVSRMRRSAYDQIMKPLGITRAQWWVLAHLSRHDGMMQTQLADVLEVGKASIGTLLDRLEASGLIERRPDASDKRAKRVYMLRAAHQLMKRLTLEEARFNERILRDLAPKEREELVRMLALIKRALSEFNLTVDTEAEFPADE